MASAIGERVEYECPGCGGSANATFTDRYGVPEWLIGCWKDGCDGRRLPWLAEVLGLPAGATKEQIVSALRKLGRSGRRREGLEPLPSVATVDGWAARLWSEPDALAYLTGRGVNETVIRNERIGWDGKRLTFPMFTNDGELVALKWRAPHAPRFDNPAGRGRDWPLYPPPNPEWFRVVIVAGEFDALAGLSAGIHASSVTLGAGKWRDEWTEQLRVHGLVLVCFDNSPYERTQARKVVARLLDAGIYARRVDLRGLGFRERDGDLCDYLASGGDPRAVFRRRRVRRRPT